MRVAITKGVLDVPPTYFAVEHALAMPDIDWRAFALVSDVTDPEVTVPVTQVLPAALPARVRRVGKWAAMRRMTRQIRAFTPDIIHQHMTQWSVLALRAAGDHTPVVTTLHGGDIYIPTGSSPIARWNRTNIHAAFTQSTALLAVSRFLADTAIAEGAPAERMDVHYQGVNTDFWTPGNEPREFDGPRRAVFVGGLTERKGIQNLLPVSAALAETHPHTLDLVGDGPLAPMVQEYVHSHPHIRWHGQVSRDRVRELYRASDFFVLPTQEYKRNREAAGLVNLEAQACGLPVIVNAVGGTPEMVDPGETGILTTERDNDSLAAAMSHLIDMPADELLDMGKRARRFVVDHRSTRIATTRLRDIYAGLGGGT